MNWYLGVLKKYADFNGRAQRAEYWYFVLFSGIVSIILTVLDVMFGLYDAQSGSGVISSLYSLGVLIPSLAVGSRRLHDIGKSGWWQLLILTIIGIFVLLVWYTIDSTEDNKYGKNPKEENSTNSINDNSIEKLEKLADLKEKGMITEEEFNSKKQQLLG